MERRRTFAHSTEDEKRHPRPSQSEGPGLLFFGEQMFLPLNLRVENRTCVVVGAGQVAQRKCRSLLRHGANIRVVATEVKPSPLWQNEQVDVIEHCYDRQCLNGALLVIAATNVAETNARIAADARELGIWVLRVDSPADSDFILPATVRRGHLTVAFGTDGRSPALASRLRREAEDRYGDEYEELSEREPLVDPPAQGGCGYVSLVGAGPGALDLITVKGASCLRRATVVVHDALSNPELLGFCGDDVECVDVGKRKGCHLHLQPEINQLLIDRARRGHRVVRLKGGDPTIFGRGGEEARALAAAGIPFEIVPGVSSVSAVPAYAGIPITDREFGASSFGVYSLHLKSGRRLSSEQWRKMADGPDTLVLLMGVSAIDEIAENLMRNGRPSETPIAIILQGTTPHQRRIVGTLDTIRERIQGELLEGPGLIVVGNVVRASEYMAWNPQEAL
jgi:uroporphyrin-III C-methyltransferase/precorrin-2 dehydrogenase/sirohydrochlorin ferrochelatase